MFPVPLAERIPGFPAARLCVALSGGIDSVALLHACHTLAATHTGLGLRALHVHHGLQAEADDWARRCNALCDSLGVPLQVIRLDWVPEPGASIEAEARAARYAALERALLPGELLLTAHHQDDQLETVLIQLFRGAGVAGLAAMPHSLPLGQGVHLRPLLDATRAGLEAYARAHGLDWIEDPMNRDPRFDRAWLRTRVLPALRARWPAVARTVSRSAAHLAEAQELLRALAALDGAPLLDGGRLAVAGLLALPSGRQANVLRWWIAGRGLGLPSARRLRSILDEVLPARDDAEPVVTWKTGEVRRYRGRLYAMAPLRSAPPRDWECELAPGQTVSLPAGLGDLSLAPSAGCGIALERVRGPLRLRFRAGGERLRPAGRRDVHRLSSLCQEAGIVPWMRDRLPLVLDGVRPIAVPGFWVASGYAAAAGQPGVEVCWRGGPAVT